MTDDIDFAGLLCSRLCHDLMSPVGALGNGLELLADEADADSRGQYLALVADSQRAVAARLQFMRLAFGAGSGPDEQVPAATLRAAAAGLLAGRGKVELGWLVDAASLPRAQARVLLILVLVAEEALVRGGRLDAGAEGAEVAVRAEGPRLVLDGGVRAVLAEGTGTPDARTAPAWLLRRLADGAVQLADGEPGTLLLAATLPAA